MQIEHHDEKRSNWSALLSVETMLLGLHVAITRKPLQQYCNLPIEYIEHTALSKQRECFHAPAFVDKRDDVMTYRRAEPVRTSVECSDHPTPHTGPPTPDIYTRNPEFRYPRYTKEVHLQPHPCPQPTSR